MSTNKTTPTRDDLASKDCASVEREQRQTRSSAPLMTILDIRYDKAYNSFAFIVSARSWTGSASELRSSDLRGIDAAYRTWMLAKFKANLRKLSVIERMKVWVVDRLTLLKEYCDINDVAYDVLYVRSGCAPLCSADHLDSRLAKPRNESQAATAVADNADDNGGSEQRAAKRKSSEDAGRLDEPSRVVLSMAMRRRLVYSRLKTMVDKFNARKSIDRETLLRELDCLRPHLSDM